jgi:hypothetical protein
MNAKRFSPALIGGALGGAVLGVAVLLFFHWVLLNATLNPPSAIFAAGVGAIAGLVLSPLLFALPEADGADDEATHDAGVAHATVEGGEAEARRRTRRRRTFAHR